MRAHLGVAVESVDPGEASLEAAVALALANVRGAGKRPALGVSILMSGCPDCDDVHFDETTIPADAPATLALGRPWTLADCRRYAKRGRELIVEALGRRAHVLTALHLDEKTVHLHFEIVACVVQPDGTVRVGNAPVREALVRLAAGFDAANAKARERLRKREAKAVKAAERAKAAGRKPRKRQRWIDHGPDAMHVDYREQMRLLHDLYADRFADFGIVRGASDAKRRYREPIDQDKADAARERSLEREATAARAALRDELERERRDVADELAQARAQRDEARADRDEADRRDGIPGILQAFTVAADRLGAALPEPLSAAILQCAEHRSTRPIYALLAALRAGAGAPAAAKVRGEGRER